MCRSWESLTKPSAICIIMKINWVTMVRSRNWASSCSWLLNIIHYRWGPAAISSSNKSGIQYSYWLTLKVSIDSAQSVIKRFPSFWLKYWKIWVDAEGVDAAATKALKSLQFLLGFIKSTECFVWAAHAVLMLRSKNSPSAQHWGISGNCNSKWPLYCHGDVDKQRGRSSQGALTPEKILNCRR